MAVGMVNIVAFALVAMAFTTNNCGGRVIAEGEGQTNWLGGVRPLVRHEREVMEMNLTEFDNTTMSAEGDTWSDACSEVYRCLGEGSGRNAILSRSISAFQFGEIYGMLESLCPTSDQGCWNKECQDKQAHSHIEHVDFVVNWMCRHKAGFKDTTCYRDPFTERMQTCANTNFEVLRTGGDFYEGFESCVFNELDSLPGCSRFNFFARFFSFVVHDQVRRNQILENA